MLNRMSNARVFISYVHEDKEVAEAVQVLLSSVLNLKEGVFLSADETQVLARRRFLRRQRHIRGSCLLTASRSLLHCCCLSFAGSRGLAPCVLAFSW